jgi:hypothetical protein
MEHADMELSGALVGALVVATVAVAVAVYGGPRRRPAMTPGVTGGRVRLPSRALERAVIAAAGILVAMLVATHGTPGSVIAATFAVACLAFAVRRGSFPGLAAREPGPDDQVDDGYVDATQGLRHE